MSWPTVPLGECARIVSGATPKTSVAEYWDGDVNWTTPKDIANLSDKFLTVTPRKITEAGLKNCSAEVLPAGSVLLSSRAPIGHVAINSVPTATNQGFKSLIPSKIVHPEYLFWWLRANRSYLESLGNGATFKEISKAVVQRIEIPLPPLEEQKRIAAILDQADALRRTRQRAIERLSALRQSIFYEMFGDPITNSEGWETVRLGDLCSVGSSKRVFVREFVDNGIPFYRGMEVGKLAEGEQIQPSLFIEPTHYADLISHSGKPQIGDLLLPSICHDGRIWRVDHDEPFYFKDGRVLWIKNDQSALNTEYLRNHLRNAFLSNYSAIASGTTFAELKIINLKNLPILLPPLDMQTQFLDRVRQVVAARQSMVQASDNQMSLFQSLQQRAFRGEL